MQKAQILFSMGEGKTKKFAQCRINHPHLELGAKPTCVTGMLLYTLMGSGAIPQ